MQRLKLKDDFKANCDNYGENSNIKREDPEDSVLSLVQENNSSGGNASLYTGSKRQSTQVNNTNNGSLISSNYKVKPKKRLTIAADGRTSTSYNKGDGAFGFRGQQGSPTPFIHSSEISPRMSTGYALKTRNRPVATRGTDHMRFSL